MDFCCNLAIRLRHKRKADNYGKQYSYKTRYLISSKHPASENDCLYLYAHWPYQYILSSENFQATGVNIAYVNILPFSFAWLYAIGRIAFSIFCFQIAEGCRYTSNIRKYFLRLFLFGIITQPVYAWAHEFDHSGNVMFTLALGVLCIAIFQKVQHVNCTRFVQYLLCAISLALIWFVSFLFQTDYWQFGVPFLVGLYLLKNRNHQVAWTFGFLFILYVLYCTWNGMEFTIFSHWTIALHTFLTLAVACISLLVIHTYRYTKMSYHKSWFYWFYPIHLLILCIIRWAIISFA